MDPSVTPEVTWIGPILNYSGLGDETRGFIGSLARLGISVSAQAISLQSPELIAELVADSSPSAVAVLAALDQSPDGARIAVYHAPASWITPVENVPVTIARTMYETDSLPTEWVERLNHVDEIWTASTFNLRTFREAGVTIPIYVVPGGIDAERFRPGLPPLDVPGLEGTVFLYSFDWQQRKGIDVLLDAWARAFGPGCQKRYEGPTLLLHVGSSRQWNGKGMDYDEAVSAILNAVGYDRNDVSPVVVSDTLLTSVDMARLMARADIYISSSRGEGWGRPMMEAIACGLPVIAPAWGGYLDFLDESNAILTNINAVVPIGSEVDIPTFAGQRWAEPSPDGLAEAMCRLCKDDALRRKLGEKGRADVEKRWQWYQVSAIAAERLKEMSGPVESTHNSHTRDTSGTRPDPIPETMTSASGGGIAAKETDDAADTAPSTQLAATISQLATSTMDSIRMLVAAVKDLDARIANHDGRIDETRGRLDAIITPLHFGPGDAPWQRTWLRYTDDNGAEVIGFTNNRGEANDFGPASYARLFGGTPEEKDHRAQFYVPHVCDNQPVLDIGCGRGEFLNVLRDNSVQARGIDLDRDCVEHCIGLGHDATCDDAVSFLKSQENDSVGSIVSIQVVEHISFNDLISFIKESLRVLRPGGPLIFETLNPHSLAAFRFFATDPSHRIPLYPEVGITLCREAGFSRARVLFPAPVGDLEANRRNCLDYAVLAQKSNLGRVTEIGHPT